MRKMWETEIAVFIVGLVFIIAITIRYAGIVAREREARRSGRAPSEGAKRKKRGERDE
jgi:uncharacterized membrane protein YecN with MAPEG domain